MGVLAHFQPARTNLPCLRGYPSPLVAQGHEAIYERFLKGALLYRPTKGSDVGMVTLPIRDLKNPLEGIFDLSKCGDTGKYLSIATGYRKGKKAENEGKVEIWFSPRFLIEKELNGTAARFEPIMAGWKQSASVGIFWTWWEDDLKYYDYLTALRTDDLSKNNLYDNWRAADRGGGSVFGLMLTRRDAAFMLCF